MYMMDRVQNFLRYNDGEQDDKRFYSKFPEEKVIKELIAVLEKHGFKILMEKGGIKIKQKEAE